MGRKVHGNMEPMPSFFEIIVLLVAGILSGFITTLASSGSTITLPLLLFLGLPPVMANATNRIHIMFGSLMAMYNYNKSKLINWNKALIITIPVILGTITGVVIASILLAPLYFFLLCRNMGGFDRSGFCHTDLLGTGFGGGI